ncbi:MAG: DUF86 domain-containing protein [Chloroflexi bacterium]|nr:DUF86 domain-containing protein [Chloroflexota bacterium]
MRGKREIVDYVWDMYENAQKAMQFVKGRQFEEFGPDEQAPYAVVRALEILGEAAKKIQIAQIA